MPLRCECEPGCENMAERRDCGHVACDGCTDDATNYCLTCVPVDDVDYANLVSRREELQARRAHRMCEDDVDDVAAAEWAEQQQLEDEVRNG